MINITMASMNKPIDIDLSPSNRSRVYAVALLLLCLSVPFAHLYMTVDLSPTELVVHSLDISFRFLLLIGLLEVGVYIVTRKASWSFSFSLARLWLGFLLVSLFVVISIYLAPHLLPLGQSIHDKHIQAGYTDMPLRSLPVGLLVAYLLYVFVRRQAMDQQLMELKKINQELEKLQHLPQSSDLPRLSIIHERQEKQIKPNTILRVQSDENYCHVYVDKDEVENHVDCYLIRRTLSDVLAELPGNLFVHSHRSHIVNLHFVSKIIREGRNRKLCMKNGEQIPISRGKLSEVQAKLARL